MAKKTVISLIDDIDGSEAAETILFSVNGTNYEIDLSSSNSKAFHKALKPYLDAGRRAATRAGRRASSAGTNPREIRAWAAANGVDVPARGRIPAGVQEQYRTANS